MDILNVPITPFPDQRPGTSGLRKKVSVFSQPGYVEAFVQSIFDALPEAVGEGVAGKTLVLGGDGRFFADQTAQTIIRKQVSMRRDFYVRNHVPVFAHRRTELYKLG